MQIYETEREREKDLKLCNSRSSFFKKADPISGNICSEDIYIDPNNKILS